MSDSVKQVKVDNWGIYFLQRLKHFFNRTDYCDLTLQFQDNAQLKVHRLVLNACTEYFELLERTCEMYEDCLVMPDDLQADVVVPIINFMYTGQLEFRLELLEKLYQTSLIMNMPVLTKLLDGHRASRAILNQYYGKKYSKTDPTKIVNVPVPSSSSNSINKRNYSTAFDNTNNVFKAKKVNTSNISESLIKSDSSQSGSSCSQFPVISEKNNKGTKDPRPTRYELPEELDEDHIFDNSFTNISYTSKPLMVHPETVKQYGSKKINLFEEGSGSSSRFIQSSADLVECKKISSNDNIFDDDQNQSIDESEMFQTSSSNKDVNSKDSSKLFDQILDSEVPKVTIEAKNKEVNNLDHAKIISEVLKKYPHLVKSNKNIKLKILNTPNKSKKSQSTNLVSEEKETKLKSEMPDFTYETDVIDSKQAAQLIALGAENIKGPWICLICGTPGRALHFTSYYNFRKHLVDVHNEKPVPTMCEYCGQKSMKRNYLLHHLLTKHGVEPPSNYHFPRCNICNYVALNEALLVKHKMSHTELKQFRCNVCASNFNSSNQLLVHIQKTGHKYSAERKTNLKCIYCLKVFLRESNLYAHLKASHKEAAKNDGIIDDSDEEHQEEEKIISKSRTMKSDHSNIIKLEVPVAFENVYEDNNVQYEIERHSDGNIRVVSKKQRVVLPKHKILNSNYGTSQQNIATKSQIKTKSAQRSPIKKPDFLQETSTNSPSNTSNDEIVLIGNKEYILRDYQLIPKKEKYIGEFVLPNTMEAEPEETLQNVLPTTSMDFQNVYNPNYDSKMFVKKSNKVNQPVQIVVSNEEEYKALMNSHQSVIYDDRDDNKTLGLLTSTDHASLENRTIDLGNSQSNNMMIIQDDFSINVSDPVSVDNPNIVVVYSHPVDNQKQQYQIITTQAVNPQFVQSSAIITQNYETVTTSTPVLSGHTSVQNPWHSNMQSNTITMTAASDIQTMTMAGSLPPIAHVENITTSDINDLPEVHLTASDAVIGFKGIVNAHNSANVHNFNQSNIISSINIQGIEQPNVITIEEQNVNNDISEQTINESYNQNDITANLIQTDSNNTYSAIPEHSQATTNTTINSDSVITAMTQGTIITSIDSTNSIASLTPGTIITSLDTSATTATINPITTLATLDPIINIGTLVPTSITTIDPITNIATLVPPTTIANLDPDIATLVPQTTIARLEDPTNIVPLVPTSTITTMDSTNLATLVPTATITTLDQTTNIITLDPTTIATLSPRATIVAVDPTSINTQDGTTTMDNRETSSIATLNSATTIAQLDAPTTIAALVPTPTTATLDASTTIETIGPTITTKDPANTIETLDPNTTTETVDPTSTTEILDPDTTETLEPDTAETLDTTTTESLDPTSTDSLKPANADSTQKATTTIASMEDENLATIEEISTVSTVETSFVQQEHVPPTTDMHDNNTEMNVYTTQSDEVSHMCTKVVNSSEIPLKTTVQIQLLPQQIHNEFPATKTNIEEMKTLNEAIDEMEVDETIENIAKDIGVNPDALNVHETPCKDLKIREEDGTLKNVVIESLTSEWSEDELETIPEQTKALDVSSEEGVELEESIENIQQEVIKQVLKEKRAMASESNISSENTVTVIEETHPSTTENPQPSEKISSLLNEWDDNDSQEAETTTTDESEINKDLDAAKNHNIDMLSVTVLSKEENIKDDNIKSLVSDWDEEDEENKV